MLGSGCIDTPSEGACAIEVSPVLRNQVILDAEKYGRIPLNISAKDVDLWERQDVLAFTP